MESLFVELKLKLQKNINILKYSTCWENISLCRKISITTKPFKILIILQEEEEKISSE